MRKNEQGFAATGMLYTILIIFLSLMMTLLVTLASRTKILNKLKEEALNENKNIVFNDGEVVYFNPETGEKCDASSAISTPGTKKGCMKWYAFNDNETSNKVSLLLDHNTTIAIGKLTGYVNSWSSLDCGDSVIVNDVLTKDTATWKGVKNVRMINKVEIGQILNQDYESCSESSVDYCLDFDISIDYNTCILPDTTTCDAIQNSKNGWLVDNLSLNSNTYGRGYYSSDSYLATSSLGNKTLVRIDGIGSYSSSYDQACDTGVRPVVTVNKEKLW